MKFLVQTDENEFLNVFLNRFPNNTIYLEEIERLDKQINCVFFTLPINKREEHAINFFSAVVLLAQCEYIITHSGNGGMWSMFYRETARNVHQNLFSKWI